MDLVGYTILGLYFAVLLLIGWFCSGRQQSLHDFFLAHRNVPAWAVMAAVVATETSAVTYIGTPTFSFKEGGDFAFLQMIFGFILARVVLSAYFLPRFFENVIVTIYQFLGRQFGGAVQTTAGIFFFITRALAAGVRHYAAALVLSSVTGGKIDILTSIWLTGIISLIYTVIGGLSAVIWTEVFQFAVMVLGSILAFAYLLYLIPGGWAEVVRVGAEHGKFTVIHWDWSGEGSFTFFLGILCGFCLNLATHGADQDLVQRLLSCRSLRGAQGALIGSGFFIFAQFTLFLLIGVMLFAFYGGHVPAGVEKLDQLFPFFIAQSLPSAIAALVLAAILSAALSSTASALNSLASSTMTDLGWLVSATPLDNRQTVLYSRLFTIFWTIVLMLIASVARHSESILYTGYQIPSLTYGSLLAAFLLGIFTKFRHQRALIFGMVAGTAVTVVMAWNELFVTWLVPTGTLFAMVTAWALQYSLTDIPTRKSEGHDAG